MASKKKHPSGFVPVNFQLAGKILLALGIILIILKGVDYLTCWVMLPNDLFLIGLALIVVSAYLIFIVPKE
jgi:hypothetical protein